MVGTLEWLVLTDVFGATPAMPHSVWRATTYVCCRVNVPMPWRSLCYASQPLDSLADRALQGGNSGIVPTSTAHD